MRTDAVINARRGTMYDLLDGKRPLVDQIKIMIRPVKE